MKLSLRWIFDHLKADLKKYKPEQIVALLNAKTAEIETLEKITLTLADFAIGTVTAASGQKVTVDCAEWKQNYELPVRDDAQKGAQFLIKKEDKKIRWAVQADWGRDRQDPIAQIHCDKKDAAGGWKKSVETQDYILEVDNKSITNRPDLWGHRGFARELSGLLGVPLLPEKNFLQVLPLKEFATEFKATKQIPFTVKNSAPKICKRFSIYSIDSVQYRPSVLWMAARLLRTDNGVISFLVDATNYAMCDFGQPIHAFDANLFPTKTIEPRMAKKDEKLTLLDGTQLTLTKEDLVISDGKKPVALGAIMGGKESGISSQTNAMLIESGNFDATAVRLAATRHKVRTDASARFEKTLDPNQNVLGTMRFLQLLKDEKLPFTGAKEIVSLGATVKPLTLKIAHSFIEKRLGIELKKGFVVKVLEPLGFDVKQSGDAYTIVVPTSRCSKDITIKEDILEEVARLYGYGELPLELPKFKTIACGQEKVKRERILKQQLAFDAGMQEVENYGFYDNYFLQKINWKVTDSVSLANPLSEQYTHLATSLVPHLLHNVEQNMANNDDLRFFEWARTWSIQKKEPVEKKALAGIFYHKKNVDFYMIKEYLVKLFIALRMPVEWKKATTPPAWGSAYQTADLYCGKQKIGSAGMVSQKCMARLGAGQAFAFELDGDALLDFVPQETCFTPLPKYQATRLDISMMVPTKTTVSCLTEAIQKADKRIFDVQLVDIFQKDEWKDQKSITMRFSIRDAQSTLSKNEIEKGYAAVQKAVKTCGAQIR